MGKYELFKDKAGQFRFRLKAGNGEIILASEGYTTKASAENGIASVRVNSPKDERYERKETAAGWSFNLRASNGQVIGTGEVYTSAAAREKGIESVKANGPDSPVEDLT